MIEWTISVGNLISLGGFAVGIIYLIADMRAGQAAMRAEMKMMETRLTGVEFVMNKITDVLVQGARTDVRLTAIETQNKDILERIGRVMEGERRLGREIAVLEGRRAPSKDED